MTNNIWIRSAGRDDVDQLAALLTYLDYPADAATVLARLQQLEKTDMDQALVAVQDGQIVGLATLHIMPAFLHRAGPIARITALVVDEQLTRQGIGRMLVNAAEELAHAAGCVSIEVSSNKRRVEAHAFYEAIGYKRESELFRKGF